jgi:acyl-CoA thioesterase FadM
MGELREYSIYPIMDKLAAMFETGGWGLATNSVKLEILGDLSGNDVVIGRVWMEEVFGVKENIFDICFEWRRKIDDGGFERVAYCKQRTSWIKITGHGEGVMDILPGSIKSFMDSMRPKLKVSKPLDNLFEPFRKLALGEELINYTKQKCELMEYTFDTSLENSNLVGNVYFANYAKWLGVVGDLYFYKIMPNFYRGIGANGEFICLNCEVDHLTEAMPFDRVLIKMYLNKVFEKGLDLDFEFFIFKDSKIIRKLAVARQRIIWVKRGRRGLEADFLPSEIIEKNRNNLSVILNS